MWGSPLASSRPIPSLDELRAAFRGAVAARELGQTADGHDGQIFDCASGMGALVWRAVAERDQECFRQVYLDGARGADLDLRAASRLQATRVGAVAGTGTARLRRTAATAGAGYIWKGTRILLSADGKDRLWFEVASDFRVGAADLVAYPSIVQSEAGQCGAVNLEAADCSILRVEDLLWDNTWTVEVLQCSAGTTYEEDHAFLARARSAILDARVGYPATIESACRAAGATLVALFPSDITGTDTGINNVVVGDSGGTTPDSLLRACRFAVARTAIWGVNAQVLPIARLQASIEIAVTLLSAPVDPGAIRRDVQRAVVGYFGARQNPFLWSRDGVRSAALRVLRDVYDVTVAGDTPPSVATFMTSPVVQWEARESAVRVSVELAE